MARRLVLASALLLAYFASTRAEFRVRFSDVQSHEHPAPNPPVVVLKQLLDATFTQTDIPPAGGITVTRSVNIRDGFVDFNVKMPSRPGADTKITFTEKNRSAMPNGYQVSPSEHTFNGLNWNTAKTFRLSGQNIRTQSRKMLIQTLTLFQLAMHFSSADPNFDGTWVVPVQTNPAPPSPPVPVPGVAGTSTPFPPTVPSSPSPNVGPQPTPPAPVPPPSPTFSPITNKGIGGAGPEDDDECGSGSGSAWIALLIVALLCCCLLCSLLLALFFKRQKSYKQIRSADDTPMKPVEHHAVAETTRPVAREVVTEEVHPPKVHPTDQIVQRNTPANSGPEPYSTNGVAHEMVVSLTYANGTQRLAPKSFSLDAISPPRDGVSDTVRIFKDSPIDTDPRATSGYSKFSISRQLTSDELRAFYYCDRMKFIPTPQYGESAIQIAAMQVLWNDRELLFQTPTNPGHRGSDRETAANLFNEDLNSHWRDDSGSPVYLEMKRNHEGHVLYKSDD